MKFASIIITHHASSPERSIMMRRSLDSLFESTTYPFELFVIDNGGNDEDSTYLLNLTEKKKINTYIRNAENMSFGFGRNQGLAQAHGDYIAICDNDILYKKDWLSECIEALEAFPNEKVYATPIAYPTHGFVRYQKGTLELRTETEVKIYKLNMRAGSNCFVIRRADMQEIGVFDIHRIAGTKWTDTAVRKGYLALVIPDRKAEDMGLRQGYDINSAIPLKTTLSNGASIHFNQDEYQKNNKSELYYDKRPIQS